MKFIPLALGATAAAAAIGAAVVVPAQAQTAVPARAAVSTSALAGPADGGVRQRLTDEQRTCLKSAGVTMPKSIPTAADVQKMRDAAAACGIEVPARLSKLGDRVAALSDEQRKCLSDAGASAWQGTTLAERVASAKRTAQNCGIEVPERLGKLAARAASLTQEQRECLKAQGVGSQAGAARADRLANLKRAAEACGISTAS